MVSSVLPIPVNRGNAQRTDQVIRTLLDLGYKVELLLLNQSEAATTSEDVKKRTLAHYASINLHVEVRRHPKFVIEKQRKAKGMAPFISRAIDRIRRGVQVITGDYAKINSVSNLPANFEKLILQKYKADLDLVWFNYARVMPNNLPKSKRVVIDLHDLQTYRVKNDILPKLQSWERARYESIFSESEKRLMRQADVCLSISSVETREIKEKFCPGIQVITVNATGEERPPLQAASENDLLFVGSNSDPNVDGLIWFLKDVWPAINEMRPSTLLIQGNITRNKKVQAALASCINKSNIRQQGFVDDLSEVYSTSKVVICPLRYGTGMKIKVIEAMSYGMPIVTTSAGLEGIDLSSGIQPYDDASHFAMQVVKLTGSPAEASKQSQAARETFRKAHSRDYMLKTFEELLSE